ncbi:MAG: asparaginase [Bacteroidota bacterium]
MITEINTGSRQTEASLLVVYTGGTIGMDYDETGKFLVPFDFDRLLEKIPELKQFGYALTLISPFEPLDSSDVHPKHWVQLARLIYENYEKYDGFLILHGTDTLAFTASALSFLLENIAKPVVLTGSQLPISAHRSDARANFISALQIAAAHSGGRPLVPEVCVFFDSFLLRGNRARKVQSVHFSAFDSPNYPHLAEAGIFMDYNSAYILPMPTRGLRLHDQFSTDVNVLKMYPGVPETYVKAVLEDPEVRGVIIESLGAGTVPSAAWLAKSLEAAAERGVILFNVSQCTGGTILQGQYANSSTLSKLGVVSGRDITFEAGLSKLMIVLGMEDSPESAKQQLGQAFCGEMRNDESYRIFVEEVTRRNLPTR